MRTIKFGDGWGKFCATNALKKGDYLGFTFVSKQTKTINVRKYN